MSPPGSDTKRPLQSRTIWGALMAIAAGLPALYQVVLYGLGLSDQPVSPEEVTTGLISILGGLAALWGRLRATARIVVHPK